MGAGTRPLLVVVSLAATGTAICLFFVTSLYADIYNFDQWIKQESREYEEISNSAWKDMASSLIVQPRTKRFDYYYEQSKKQCNCGQGPNNCPRGPPGPRGEPGRKGRHGRTGANGPDGLSWPKTTQPAQQFDYYYQKPCTTISCPPGLPGSPGSPGLQGITGPSGLDASPGLSGRNGFPGQLGRHGDHGIRGPPGPRGQSGYPGQNGSRFTSRPGERGRQGQRGMNGKPGLIGLPGHDGIPGVEGYPGMGGIHGIPGVPGADGLDGGQGWPGNDGGYCKCPERISELQGPAVPIEIAPPIPAASYGGLEESTTTIQPANTNNQPQQPSVGYGEHEQQETTQSSTTNGYETPESSTAAVSQNSPPADGYDRTVPSSTIQSSVVTNPAASNGYENPATSTTITPPIIESHPENASNSYDVTTSSEPSTSTSPSVSTDQYDNQVSSPSSTPSNNNNGHAASTTESSRIVNTSSPTSNGYENQIPSSTPTSTRITTAVNSNGYDNSVPSPHSPSTAPRNGYDSMAQSSAAISQDVVNHPVAPPRENHKQLSVTTKQPIGTTRHPQASSSGFGDLGRQVPSSPSAPLIPVKVSLTASKAQSQSATNVVGRSSSTPAHSPIQSSFPKGASSQSRPSGVFRVNLTPQRQINRGVANSYAGQPREGGVPYVARGTPIGKWNSARIHPKEEHASVGVHKVVYNRL